MPGDVLEASQDADSIVLHHVAEEDPLVEKDGVLVHNGRPTADLVDAVRLQREEHMARVRGWQAIA